MSFGWSCRKAQNKGNMGKVSGISRSRLAAKQAARYLLTVRSSAKSRGTSGTSEAFKQSTRPCVGRVQTMRRRSGNGKELATLSLPFRASTRRVGTCLPITPFAFAQHLQIFSLPSHPSSPRHNIRQAAGDSTSCFPLAVALTGSPHITPGSFTTPRKLSPSPAL
ncbi:uncharacterized protein BKA78DRAFT_30299 [Phyllosticta capitalensis]|uniref:uncharacterized protein n=1 Tax=Phyllosticta capitalensis TaxID=121624 RepID=UPI0031309100